MGWEGHSLGLGRRNTPWVRGPAQCGVWQIYTGLRKSHLCQEEGDVHAGKCTCTCSQEGCKHMYSQESHAHTHSQRGLCTHKGLAMCSYRFASKVIFTSPIIQQVT